MFGVSTRWFFCFATLVLTACTDRSALEQQARAPQTHQLIGTWDVRFHLERAPLLTLNVNHAIHDVEGELAFVPNRWLARPYPDIQSPAVYGTYDVDFTPFGFDPRRSGETPTAVAGWLREDSVKIVLGSPDGETRVLLGGRMMNDSVRGVWTVSISRSGGGGGTFVIVRHRNSQ